MDWMMLVLIAVAGLLYFIHGHVERTANTMRDIYNLLERQREKNEQFTAEVVSDLSSARSDIESLRRAADEYSHRYMPRTSDVDAFEADIFSKK